ncbi:MAG: hypothetical protein ACK56I_31480, partial [bacterium]
MASTANASNQFTWIVSSPLPARTSTRSRVRVPAASAKVSVWRLPLRLWTKVLAAVWKIEIASLPLVPTIRIVSKPSPPS